MAVVSSGSQFASANWQLKNEQGCSFLGADGRATRNWILAIFGGSDYDAGITHIKEYSYGL